jgi:fermentation-respiration switch protein FrsA (DUF1100 family)
MERAIRLAGAVIGAICVSGMVIPATGVAVTAPIAAPTLVRHVVEPITSVSPPPVPPTEPVSAPPAPEPAPPEPPSAIRVTLLDDARGRTLVTALHVPTAASGGPYPLVVFAHGFGVSAATYSVLEQQLADAGFVVAAPDFPFTSDASGNGLDRDDVVNQAADVSFVISQLLDQATAPVEVRGLVNATAPVGVVGHSDGGVTAAAVAYNDTVADSRVGAAVVLSGAEIDYPGSWFTNQSPPLLAIHGDADEVNPYWASEQLYADARGQRRLVTVLGGSHLGPFTRDPVEGAVAVLVADFLRGELAGDGDARGRIESDANREGLVLAAA